jgi:restriction system protein
MANVSRRRTGEFLRALFALLIKEPSGMKAGILIDQVRASSNLTEWERGQYQSGGQRFEKILRFATVDCVKAGWLQKAQGVWSITEAGQKAFAQYQDPEAFYKEACRLYSIWRQERDAVAGAPPSQLDDSEIEVDAEKLSFTFEEAEEQAWSQIEKFLQTSDPFEFQEIVADLLRAHSERT